MTTTRQSFATELQKIFVGALQRHEIWSSIRGLGKRWMIQTLRGNALEYSIHYPPTPNVCELRISLHRVHAYRAFSSWTEGHAGGALAC